MSTLHLSSLTLEAPSGRLTRGADVWGLGHPSLIQVLQGGDVQLGGESIGPCRCSSFFSSPSPSYLPWAYISLDGSSPGRWLAATEQQSERQMLVDITVPHLVLLPWVILLYLNPRLGRKGNPTSKFHLIFIFIPSFLLSETQAPFYVLLSDRSLDSEE